MSMTGLFLDTNVLLHYRRADEIDWLKFSGANAAVLAICPVVIRELDHHKDSHPQNKLRKRALEVIADLQSKLERSTELRAGVNLEFLARYPQIHFATHGLHREVNDDWLIATHATEFRHERATALPQLMVNAANETSPWAAFSDQHTLWSPEGLTNLANQWSNLVARHLSIGDATISQVADHHTRMGCKVEIYTGDQGLRQHNHQAAPLQPRRRK
jgi:hypothetical protein